MKVGRIDVREDAERVHWYDDLAGMRRVRERTGVPVTAGQS